MTPFALQSITVRTVILLGFLILQLLSIFVFTSSLFLSKRKKTILSSGLMLILCFVILTSLTAGLYSISNDILMPNFVDYAINLSTRLYIFLLLLGLFGALYFINQEKIHTSSSITGNAIKETVDNLPAGLCFAKENGVIILSNRCMDMLVFMLMGQDLQDIYELWTYVNSNSLPQGVQRVSSSGNPIIRLPDGTTWIFEKRSIQVDGKNILQITAIDNTDSDALRIRLEEVNKQLSEMNERLHNYSASVVDVTAKEERLATKIRLHRELGHALLSTRYALTSEKAEEESKVLLDLWRRNIAVLLTGVEMKRRTVFEDLVIAAKDVGIDLILDGVFPEEDEPLVKLIISAASESINNAVRHANADKLFMTIKNSEKDIITIFTNNGKLPLKKITEGGGLSTLRARIEQAGGVMKVQRHPGFKLTITIPRKGEALCIKY